MESYHKAGCHQSRCSGPSEGGANKWGLLKPHEIANSMLRIKKNHMNKFSWIQAEYSHKDKSHGAKTCFPIGTYREIISHL